jgi:hypothetical protein
MTTETTTDVNPPEDPEKTGTGTNGHPEGNSSPTNTPQSDEEPKK